MTNSFKLRHYPFRLLRAARVEQPWQVRAVWIAPVLDLRRVALRTVTDLGMQHVAHWCGRSMLGEKPRDTEPAVPIAPPASDFNHFDASGEIAQRDPVACHHPSCSLWSPCWAIVPLAGL